MPFSKGFITTASLIVAIGAQNAFVLTQSIRRQYHYTIAALCIALDIVLISLGVFAVSSLAQADPKYMQWMTWIGATFLFAYGAMSFRSAFKRQALTESKDMITSRRRAIIMTLAMTLLNPHAYLDTVVLIGSVGAQYADGGSTYFVIGACIASFLWFAGLSIGGSYMRPWFENPKTWQVLDVFIGIMMWGIGLGLVL